MNNQNYPFVISPGAKNTIIELGISYEDILKIPKEFDKGGCHTFLLKSDILRYIGDKIPPKKKRTK
tara:strand:- start:491 stop:688 length:198 start_codon:yes stop_codon:yes gene_type:complete